MIRRMNYVKSLDGFKTRMLSKITTLTTIQCINKFVLIEILTILKSVFY